MKLHFNEDGSIFMILNLRGVKIEKLFSSYNEYYNYLGNLMKWYFLINSLGGNNGHFL